MFSLNSVILPFVEIVVYIYCILTFRCACCFFKKNFFQQLEDPYFHSTSHVYIITFYSAWNLLSLYLIFLLFAVSLKWYSLTIILYLYNGMILFCFPLFFSLILSLKKKLQNCIFDLFQTCNVYTLFFFTCALILFGLGYRVTYRKCSLFGNSYQSYASHFLAGENSPLPDSSRISYAYIIPWILAHF